MAVRSPEHGALLLQQLEGAPAIAQAYPENYRNSGSFSFCDETLSLLVGQQ
jgi:hypothetical protein